MDFDHAPHLEKITGRQKRPATGDAFRVKLLGGDYYFGLVVDGKMAVGPMAPGSILAVVFAGSSATGTLTNPDELCERSLLMPAQILNQRPWTMGYAEKIGTTERFPKVDYVLKSYGFGIFVDRYGNEVVAPSRDTPIGVWGIGDESILSEAISEAVTAR